MPRAKKKHEPRPRPPKDSSDGEDGTSPRAFWSGAVTFGLVTLPVELFPATRNESAKLRMLDTDGTPLARHFYCPEDDTEVPPEHLVRGFEVEEGHYVVITDEELEKLEPKKSREIDLRLFVDRDTLDPLYFDRAYFLLPGEGAKKAYALLASVMERTGRAGIATFVLRDREYLIAILSERGLLHGQILRFHESVRSAKDVLGSTKTKASPALVKTFEKALARLSGDALPEEDMNDAHADAIRELAEKKFREKRDVVHSDVPAPPDPDGGELIDLMAALKRSLAAPGRARAVGKEEQKAGKRPATITPLRKASKRPEGRRSSGVARRARRPA